ncbi:TonB-dependent receptor [Pedobacter sp.]|uniref:SusC/RagA family TonB-linked outer membrane protein n=1 Tax=Pedobacter sp. TaxID=1411316 RepID=UPI002CC7003E|nr:TonB-dependent receptor [Pedobacter sp.]HWW38886.1 TonB-dependent receptor [Pedobacter sp.]
MKFYFVFICSILGLLHVHAAKYPGPDSSTTYSFAGKKPPRPERSVLTPVTGMVTDEKGEHIPGVTVKLKGTTTVTQTDGSGRFKLSIAELRGTLVFSYTGFITKEVPLTASLVYHVKLFPDLNALDEVVVVGYGTSTKRDLTGSISQVKMEDLQKAPVASFEEALAGRVAGVQVSASDGQPGAGLQISIRGNNSVTQSNSPLYVIDGFPIEDPANNVINPAEIESIDILKDASATAIYGARGANGVIIVTTKKGKIGPPTITYQNYFGFQQNLKKQEMMNAYDFVKYQLEFNPDVYTPIYLKDGRNLDYYKNVESINWQDKIFRTAPVQNHFLSMNGGTDKTRYSVSTSILDQGGIILNSGFKRYQGRVVLDQTVTPNLKVGVNANYSYTKTYGTIAAERNVSPTASLMYSVWGYRPVTGDPLKDDQLLTEPFDPDVNPSAEYRINPVISTQNEYNPSFVNALQANAYGEYTFLKNFTFRTSGGITKRSTRKEIFNNANTRAGNPLSSSNGINGSINNIDITDLLNENTLTFKKTINKVHNINALAGFTLQKTSGFTSGFSATQLPNESLGISGLDEGIPNRLTSMRTEATLMSFLTRVNYSYKSRYLFTASLRADGSSKFAKGNQWAYFPSGSFAWTLSDEPFMKSIPYVSNAKLRTSYGLTGNNRVSDYASMSTLQIISSSGYNFNNSPFIGSIPNLLGNRNLKWETTAQADIGLDVNLFKDRVSLTVDYYDKKTYDLLLNSSLAPSQGYLTGIRNVGKVGNKGWEFTVNTVNIQNKNFTWSTNFNISFNKNKVIKLAEQDPSILSRITWGNFNNAYPYIALPGHPIAQFYGYVWDGVYQYADFNQQANGTYVLKDNIPNNGQSRATIQPGFIKYKDINGDGMVNSFDQTIIGNPNPIHTGGLSNNFSYKGFDLNIFLQWSYGNDILNANRIEFEGGENRSALNMFAAYANRWTPENQTNDLYKVYGQGPMVYSSRTIEDGSYLRLKTVALGYSFKTALLKRIKIKSLRVYASAQNLYTWTNYSGLDPDVSTWPSALTPGFDWSAYPKARTLTFGLNLTL